MVGGFVNGVGLPAVPDDVEPGAGEDACGVGVIVSAGSGAVVKSGRPLKKSEIPNDVYEAELFRFQTEFVKLQEWERLMAGRASPRAGRRIRRLHPRHRPRRLPCDARQSRRADCGSRSGRRSRRGHHVELVAIDGCHPRIRRRRRAGDVVPAGRPLPADQAGESSALLIGRRVRSAYARVRLSPSDPTRHPTPPPAQRRGVRLVLDDQLRSSTCPQQPPCDWGTTANQTGSQTLRWYLGARREVGDQRIGVGDQMGGVDGVWRRSVVLGKSGRRAARVGPGPATASARRPGRSSMRPRAPHAR